MTKIDRTKPLPTEGLVQLDGHGLLATFIAALELERERQGLTKAQLAERLEVPPSRVTEWTSGKVAPSIAVIERWIRALGLRVATRPRPATIDPAALTDEKLAEFHWALSLKQSRRVAKAVLSATLEDGHATSADVDAVAQHLAGHPRRAAIEAAAQANRDGYEDPGE